MKKQKLTEKQETVKKLITPLVRSILNEGETQSEVSPEQIKILKQIDMYTSWLMDLNRKNKADSVEKYKELVLKLLKQL